MAAPWWKEKSPRQRMPQAGIIQEHTFCTAADEPLGSQSLYSPVGVTQQFPTLCSKFSRRNFSYILTRGCVSDIKGEVKKLFWGKRYGVSCPCQLWYIKHFLLYFLTSPSEKDLLWIFFFFFLFWNGKSFSRLQREMWERRNQVLSFWPFPCGVARLLSARKKTCCPRENTSGKYPHFSSFRLCLGTKTACGYYFVFVSRCLRDGGPFRREKE